MKRKRTVFIPVFSRAVWSPALTIVSLAFLLGILLGCFWAGSISDAEGSALASYIRGYFEAARGGELASPDVLSVLWETIRWPALIFLLSFTAAGLIGIPIVFGVRSFLLSFTVASFVKVLGGMGAVLSVLLFGITSALSLPVLFVLGTQGMEACRSLTGRLMGDRRKKAIYGKGFFVHAGICCAVLVCCVCLEQTVVASLIMVWARIF